MTADSGHPIARPDWREGLPALVSARVTLREVAVHDCAAVTDVLLSPDASRFGVDGDAAVTTRGALEVIAGAARERAAGRGFTYAVTLTESAAAVGLIQVRQLDPTFEAAEWEMTLAAMVRGTGVFVETARLVGTFVFGTIGAHRLEIRVQPHNGRAVGALRKIGAVQEGVLRRSLRRGGKYVDQVLWSILKDDWPAESTAAGSRVH